MLYTGASEENYRKNHARKTRKNGVLWRALSLCRNAGIIPSFDKSFRR